MAYWFMVLRRSGWRILHLIQFEERNKEKPRGIYGTLAASTFMNIPFQDYEIEITNDTTFKVGSADNTFTYDFVYQDEEAKEYESSKHASKVFQDGQLIKSAIVCAVGGSTTIHDKSAVVKEFSSLNCLCWQSILAITSWPTIKMDNAG
jgi:hypothetical protein